MGLLSFEKTGVAGERIMGYSAYKDMKAGETIAERYGKQAHLYNTVTNEDGTVTKAPLRPEQAGLRARVMVATLIVAALFWATGAIPIGFTALLVGALNVLLRRLSAQPRGQGLRHGFRHVHFRRLGPFHGHRQNRPGSPYRHLTAWHQHLPRQVHLRIRTAPRDGLRLSLGPRAGCLHGAHPHDRLQRSYALAEHEGRPPTCRDDAPASDFCVEHRRAGFAGRRRPECGHAGYSFGLWNRSFLRGLDKAGLPLRSGDGGGAFGLLLLRLPGGRSSRSPSTSRPRYSGNPGRLER